jgi:hypothetical protein
MILDDFLSYFEEVKPELKKAIEDWIVDYFVSPNRDEKDWICKNLSKDNQRKIFGRFFGDEVPMIELVDFCESYNSIGFGKATIVELESSIIVKLYNAGFSENEERDWEFKQKYSSCIIFDRHPITIAEFSKLDLHFGKHVVDFEEICETSDFKQKEFSYEIKLE